MGGSNTTVYYDQKQNYLIDGSNVAGAFRTTTNPKIFRNNEHYIIRGYIYSDASTTTAADLSGISTWSAKIGTAGSTALITVANAEFNQVADWSLANAAAGQICFNCNTAGSAIDTALGSLSSKQYLCHIIGEDGDGDDRTIAQFDITLTNTPD